MELRHIRYFLAVAKERNFTRAAARLGIGQPPLSQQVKDLERELGLALFRRLPQGVELTPAGRAFSAEAEMIVVAANRATSSAQQAARGERGQLRLGFTGSAHYNALVTRSIRDFRQAYPNISVELVESNSAILLETIHEHRTDAVFIRASPADLQNSHTLLVDTEPLIAVLPRAHHCASMSEIRLEELSGDPLVMFPHAIGSTLYDTVISACREAGFEPRLGQEAPQIGSVVNFVAAGFGVSLVPMPICQIKAEGVVYIPLSRPQPRINLFCAWRRDERLPTVLNFVQSLRTSLSASNPAN